MADPQKPMSLNNQTALELIYAVKGLAQALEYMHSDLKRLLEEEGRDKDRALERLGNQLAEVQRAVSVLPITTSDRLESLLDRKVNSAVDDTRRMLDDLRMKFWLAAGQPRGADASGSGMMVKDGIPVPISEDVTGRNTLHDGGVMKVEGKFNAAKIAKLWAIGKWVVASLAAAGGVAGIVKAVLAILHGL